MADANVSKKRNRVKPLAQEYLREILDYNPETGEFRWKYRKDVPPEWNTRWAGTSAGSMALGYRIICINFVDYRAHVLAWRIITGKWPKEEIDHKDLNRGNNIFINLREANRHQNNCNLPKRKDNTSGFKGVSFTKEKYWRARIFIKGEEIVLGYFYNKEKAAQAYKDAIKKYYGEFGRIE